MSDQHPIHKAVAAALASGEAGIPVSVPVGRTVLCDACDTDLTDDPRGGGFLFDSAGYGPCCAEQRLASIRGYGEEDHIRAWCPDGVSFADWIRSLRGPYAAITVTPGRPGTRPT